MGRPTSSRFSITYTRGTIRRRPSCAPPRGRVAYRLVHVVVVGCGRVGSELALALERDGHTVAVIDKNRNAFRRLPERFTGRAVLGFGFDRDHLEQAGIREAEALAAVTSGDNSNILTARIARETFEIPNVVARIYDPRRAVIYQRLGIPTVATVAWTTDQVRRRLLPDRVVSEWTDPSGEVGWFIGDACEVSSLHEAGLADVDVVVAATGDDEDNLVVSLLAKQEFAVPRVVARVNHPKNEWLFNEAWGVDVSVSTPHLLTALVEEAVSVGSLVRLLQFEDARLVEVTLAEDSPAAGQQIATMGVPRDATIVAVIRERHVIVPRGETTLQAGDEVLVLVTGETEDEV